MRNPSQSIDRLTSISLTDRSFLDLILVQLSKVFYFYGSLSGCPRKAEKINGGVRPTPPP
ncbi:MAG: hypothetical protein ACOYME_04875 [Prochlorotrichaceae cyanobacterium]